jgi:hypothetical protein
MVADLEPIVRAAYYGNPAWHSLGIVAETDDIMEFRKLAGMNYRTVKLAAISCPDIDVIRAIENGTLADLSPEKLAKLSIVPNQFNLIRKHSDDSPDGDDKVVSPATVTDAYGTVSTYLMAEPLAPLVEQGYARPDAFFTLRNGNIEVMTLKLIPLQERTVDGDQSKRSTYLVFQNFHGRGAFRGVITDIRAVCSNTVAMAFGGGADIRIPHSKTVEERISAASKTWENLQAEIARMDRETTILAGVKVDIPDTVEEILGIAEKKRNGEKVTTQAETRSDRLIHASRYSPGTNGETLLDIFNGASFLATHDPFGRGGAKDDIRMDSVLNGTRGKSTDRIRKSLLAIAESK